MSGPIITITKMQAIANQACANLGYLMKENESEIEDAWIASISEAQLQEKGATFKLAFAITLDVDKGRTQHVLSWSVAHKLELSGEMPDPQQRQLPLTGAPLVEVLGGLKEPRAIKRAAKKLFDAVTSGGAVTITPVMAADVAEVIAKRRLTKGQE